MQKQEKKYVPEFYSEEERKEIADKILKLFGNGYKPAVDKIVSFAENVKNDYSTVEMIEIEDLSSKKLLKHIKEFSEIKKSAKFKALDKLIDIVKFEEEIISIFVEEEQKYFKQQIGSHYQLKNYQLKTARSNAKKANTSKKNAKKANTSKKNAKKADTSKKNAKEISKTETLAETINETTDAKTTTLKTAQSNAKKADTSTKNAKEISKTETLAETTNETTDAKTTTIKKISTTL